MGRVVESLWDGRGVSTYGVGRTFLVDLLGGITCWREAEEWTGDAGTLPRS